MRNWAIYYVNFIISFLSNLWELLKSLGLALWKFSIQDVGGYLTAFIKLTGDFKFFDWLAYLFVLAVNVGFIVLIVLRITQHARRYKKYKIKKVEKEELLDEIEALNEKIEELVQEKTQILGMKVTGGRTFANGTVAAGNGQGGLFENMQENSENTEEGGPVTDSRFVKLTVDEKYENLISNVNMGPDDFLNLPQLVERFINYSASQLGLFYDAKIIQAFFAGLATTKIMILEGISGTGKTSLPYAMGKFFGNDCAICSVQPSWRDRQEILGYLNEFTKKFNETDFLKAVYETTYREDINFIVLDEMNLARIEYYFAEFLSIMEMPDVSEWKIDLVPDELPSDPKNLVNGKLLVPQNVWFIGTANRDDSTFTITDKVYDRATIIEMNARAKLVDAPFTPGVTMSYEYLYGLFENAIKEHAMDTKSLDLISKIDGYIVDNLKVTFGNRILKQLKTFVPVYVACGGTEIEAIDYFICRKVLRKFESLNLSFLHDELNGLIAFLDKTYGKGQCTECISYIKDLIMNS